MVDGKTVDGKTVDGKASLCEKIIRKFFIWTVFLT